MCVLASLEGPHPLRLRHHYHRYHHHHHRRRRVFAAVGAQTGELGATVATLWRVRTVVPSTSDGTVVSNVTTVTSSKGKGIPLQALTYP